MTLSLADITAAIVAALAVDLGTFDLSSTDNVRQGTYALPPLVPFAGVAPPEVASEPQGRARWYVRTATYTVHLWGACTSDQPGNRAERSVLLMDEAMAALETARRTASDPLVRCRTFVVRGSVPDPAAAAVPMSFARATLTIELTYRRTSGVGG